MTERVNSQFKQIPGPRYPHRLLENRKTSHRMTVQLQKQCIHPYLLKNLIPRIKGGRNRNVSMKYSQQRTSSWAKVRKQQRQYNNHLRSMSIPNSPYLPGSRLHFDESAVCFPTTPGPATQPVACTPVDSHPLLPE